MNSARNFTASIGGEAIKQMLTSINAEEEQRQLREELESNPPEMRRKKIVKRFKNVEAFL